MVLRISRLVSHLNKDDVLLAFILIVILAVMIFFRPDFLPPPGFDEGWTLSVARNWVENGKYALRQENTWVSGYLMAQPFSVTMLVGMSLRLFGIGILQARLPIILLTVASLWGIFRLSYKIFGRHSAWMALISLLVMVPFAELHPIIFGRQALGEIPMLFYLLTGYWFWSQAIKGSKIAVFLAGLFWGLALLTKRQPLPFWLFSLLVITCIAYIKRHINIFRITLGTGVFTAFFLLLFQQVERMLVSSLPTNGPSIQGLFELAAWTFNPSVRQILFCGLPILCLSSVFGLIHAIPRLKDILIKSEGVTTEDWLEIALFSLVSSWFFWFVFGSLAWVRYYQPVFMLSAPFFGKFMYDSLKQLWPPSFIKRQNTHAVRKSLSLSTIICCCLIAESISIGALTLKNMLAKQESEAQLMANFINENTNIDAKVETYESEMFFFLQRPYHYPPDQLQVDLNRKTFLNENIQITYNPLTANPDYLIVGYMNGLWGLYEKHIREGDFQLVYQLQNYALYERVYKTGQ